MRKYEGNIPSLERERPLLLMSEGGYVIEERNNQISVFLVCYWFSIKVEV